jgi:hypothetical protein
MARHFTVTLTSGTNVGPYDIYYDQINSSNFATLYGTANDADGLTLSEVQSGVVVSVPNSASTILLYNTNADFNTDCQTTTITYNIPGQVTPTPTATQVPTSTPTPTPTSTPVPTSSPTPVPTNEPTPSPTSTSIPPTPTSSPTPVPTNEPTPTPTSTPTPTPTATVQNTGTCQFWQVDLQEIDQTRYGIAYTHPTSGATQSRFSQLQGSLDPTDENIVVFGVCSESQSSIYDFDNNQMVIPQVGITQLADGGVCTSDNECTWTFQPTPTPTSTSVSPTPTEVVCRTYDCFADGGESVMFEYINCGGSSQTVMVPLGDSVEICAREGSVIMLPNNGTIIPGQLCSGDLTPTPTATTIILPTPTPTDTPSGTGIPPTQVPTSTPTPTATANNLNTFYITSNSLTLDYFCDNNVNVSTEVQSTASGTSTLLGTTIYDVNGNPVVGQPARYVVVSSVTGTTNNILSPWTYINIDSTGEVIDQGNYNCSGGGQVPNSESINPTPTPESSD